MRKIILLILCVFLSVVIFPEGVLNREISIQCPSLNTNFSNKEALEKINQSLCDHSMYAFYKEYPNAGPNNFNIWYLLQYKSEYEVKLHTRKYLSVYFDQYILNEGAMHGAQFVHGVVFDRDTGKEVKVAEILHDVPDYEEKIVDYLEKNYYWGRLPFEAIIDNGFYITEDSIVLLYYESYGGGCTYKLTVPFSFLKTEDKKSDLLNLQIKVSEDGMVLVERGSFLMGDEWGDLHYHSSPVHEISFTYDFEIGQYEVTNTEFVEFLNDADIKFSEVKDRYFGRYDVIECYMNGKVIFSYSEANPENEAIMYDGENWYVRTEHGGVPISYGEKPVVCVTWYGAVEYCNWLNRKKGLESAYIFDSEIDSYKISDYPENKSYRLPTESEWEYAARGGKFSQGYRYSGSDDIDDVCWYGGNCSIIQAVGLKSPNELGIFDMSGNIGEWCSDNCYDYDVDCLDHEIDFYYQSKTKKDLSSRINRGGDWFNGESSARVANHTASNPESSKATMGFRLARSR